MPQAPTFSLTSLPQDKVGILCHWRNNYFIYRYAYTSRSVADEVMSRLTHNFGQPVGEQADLEANYWYIPSPKQLHTLEIVKRTRGENLYILQP